MYLLMFDKFIRKYNLLEKRQHQEAINAKKRFKLQKKKKNPESSQTDKRKTKRNLKTYLHTR